MPEFVSICPDQFARIEHYKSGERATVWIKLYLDLLENFIFCTLPDETKWHFVGLMMFAAKNFNRLPTDLNFLRQKISATSEINLEILLQKGLLIRAKRMKINGAFASTEQEQEQEQRKNKEKDKQTDENQKGLFVVSPEKSVHSAEVRQAYFEQCTEINNPPAFLNFLSSGKDDLKISAWLEKQNVETESDETALSRIGARSR